MKDGLWKGAALGCFLLAFSVLMDCVVRVGDWDILGVGKSLGDGGMGETPKKERTDIYYLTIYEFNSLIQSGTPWVYFAAEIIGNK